MNPLVTTVRRTAVVIVLSSTVIAASSACAPTPPEPDVPIDEDTYVAVMSELADLERFPPRSGDRATREAAGDSARRAILDRYGVTADDLLAFAEVVGEQPQRMVEIAERISVVTDSLARPETRRTRTDSAAAVDSATTREDTATGPRSLEPAAVDTGGERDGRSLPERLREPRRERP